MIKYLCLPCGWLSNLTGCSVSGHSPFQFLNWSVRLFRISFSDRSLTEILPCTTFLCLCKSLQRTLSSFAIGEAFVVSRKRMQRYGFFPLAPNIFGKNMLKILDFNSCLHFKGGYTLYYIGIWEWYCARQQSEHNQTDLDKVPTGRPKRTYAYRYLDQILEYSYM